MNEIPDVTIKVSKELFAQLGEWSSPVEVMIERPPSGEHTMIARVHHCKAKR